MRPGDHVGHDQLAAQALDGLLAAFDCRLYCRYVAAHDVQWGAREGNYWSNYLGWDRDGDGVGDVPYEANDVVDRLSWQHPMMKLLLASPAVQTLRMVGQQFPLLRAPSIVDPHPRMQPGHTNWRIWLGKYFPGAR